jgi:hypothetical protein
VALFIGAARPQANAHSQPALVAVLAAAAAATALAAIAVAGGALAGRLRHVAAQSGAFAAAAGIFYALQDVATRGAIDVVQQHRLSQLVRTGWPYVLLAAATAGVLVSQAAFRAARLDWSLPPTIAAQPIIAVPMAVGLLRDQLRLTPAAVAVEVISLPLTLLGVLIVGRSLALRRAHGLPEERLAELEAAD